ncbi:hypothetical protein RJ639_040427 [Escallonia herrerae]|uniref:cAMP-regulated phosphoprotein 19-related protein n=1 Tax=Escallonia herrerae TaxID=1293975 RepID=A0AA88WTM2_9ASTE|nr:hypothetical protein RJ639_040427 [Escallonia herrerae]
MSDTNSGNIKEHDLIVNAPKVEVDDDLQLEEPINSDKTEENLMPSPQQEEETIKKKYGGLLPRKTPLISKDHERAFFDSADWALGKQGQKSKGPLEALRPKLQPTPHQQIRSRRSPCAPAEEGEADGGGNSDGAPSEDNSCTLDDANNDSTHSEEQICHK